MVDLKSLTRHKAGMLGKAVRHSVDAAPWSIRGSSWSNHEILPLHRAVLTWYWVQNTHMCLKPGGLSTRLSQPPDTYMITAHAFPQARLLGRSTISSKRRIVDMNTGKLQAVHCRGPNQQANHQCRRWQAPKAASPPSQS